METVSHSAEKRAAARVDVQMPITLEGDESSLHDLSTTGLCFESDHPWMLGAELDLTIGYLMDGHNFPLKCRAVVVRVQPLGERYSIAAKLLQPFDQG